MAGNIVVVFTLLYILDVSFNLQLQVFSSYHLLRIIGYSKENLKIHTGSLPSFTLPSPSSPPLPSHPLPFPSLPISPLPLEVGPLKFSQGVWGSAVSSPSGVRGGAPAEIDFGAFLS